MNAHVGVDEFSGLVHHVLQRVAERVPPALRVNVVVIVSIATAWAFRDVSGTHSVATKDIDLLLLPAVDAVGMAETLCQELLDEGWMPLYPNGIQPGAANALDDRLPALCLSPPGDPNGWFVELVEESLADQTARKHSCRFKTDLGDSGPPSFRYMRVAVQGAKDTVFGRRIARPARMALAHLLEHADPDRTPISDLPGDPPRFPKDVGRAVALRWQAREQSSMAAEHWLAEWRDTMVMLRPDKVAAIKASARTGLASASGYLARAHAIALNGVLAPPQMHSGVPVPAYLN